MSMLWMNSSDDWFREISRARAIASACVSNRPVYFRLPSPLMPHWPSNGTTC